MYNQHMQLIFYSIDFFLMCCTKQSKQTKPKEKLALEKRNSFLGLIAMFAHHMKALWLMDKNNKMEVISQISGWCHPVCRFSF